MLNYGNNNRYCSFCGSLKHYCRDCGEEIHHYNKNKNIPSFPHSCKSKFNRVFTNIDTDSYCRKCGGRKPASYYCTKCGGRIHLKHHCLTDSSSSYIPLDNDGHRCD